MVNRLYAAAIKTLCSLSKYTRNADSFLHWRGSTVASFLPSMLCEKQQ